MAYTRIGGLLTSMPKTFAILQVGGARTIQYHFLNEDGRKFLHSQVDTSKCLDEWEKQWVGVWKSVLVAKKEYPKRLNIDIEYPLLVYGLTGERVLGDEISKDYARKICDLAKGMDWMGVREFPKYSLNWIDF